MATNLTGVDTRIDEMKAVRGTATGWTTKVEAVVDQQFGSATTDLGLLSLAAVPNIGTIPIGAVLPFAGATLPSDYIECDGQALSRQDFSELFAILGTRFGAAGANLFRVPDLRRRQIRGAAVAADIGTVTGSEVAIMTESQMPQHSHSVNGSLTIATAGAHSHTYRGGVQSGAGTGIHASFNDEYGRQQDSKQTGTAGAHTHTIEGQSGDAGESSSIGIMAPSIVMTYAIKAR